MLCPAGAASYSADRGGLNQDKTQGALLWCVRLAEGDGCNGHVGPWALCR
jgi:hypothetical protein